MRNLKPTVGGKQFESIRNTDKNGNHFWFASDLMVKLEYERKNRFFELIHRAKAACRKSGNEVTDHFSVVGKKVSIGSGAERVVWDYALTRYACYLIAQNGDPRKKEEIALAQTYFAYQTRKQEAHQENMVTLERLNARQKLSQTEKEFAAVIFERGINGTGLAIIKSLGDKALFGGTTTQAMKQKLGVGGKRPLADFLPTITIKAKDLAAEMTTFKTREKGLRNVGQIKGNHVGHNQSVRGVLTKEGIFPEKLPPEEDIKKLERRIKRVDREAINNSTTKKLKSTKEFDQALKELPEA